MRGIEHQVRNSGIISGNLADLTSSINFVVQMVKKNNCVHNKIFKGISVKKKLKKTHIFKDRANYC